MQPDRDGQLRPVACPPEFYDSLHSPPWTGEVSWAFPPLAIVGRMLAARIAHWEAGVLERVVMLIPREFRRPWFWLLFEHQAQTRVWRRPIIGVYFMRGLRLWRRRSLRDRFSPSSFYADNFLLIIWDETRWRAHLPAESIHDVPAWDASA